MIFDHNKRISYIIKKSVTMSFENLDISCLISGLDEIDYEEKIKQLNDYFIKNNCEYISYNTFDKNIFDIIYNLCIHNDTSILNVPIENIQNNELLRMIGSYLYINSKEEAMIQYYLKAVNNCDTLSMVYMGTYYKNLGIYDVMFQYYKMALRCGDKFVLSELGHYYYKIKEYNHMKAYYDLCMANKLQCGITLINDYLKNIYDPAYAMQYQNILNHNNKAIYIEYPF